MILFLYPENDTPSLWLMDQLRNIYFDKIVCISDIMLVKHTKIEISLLEDGISDTFNLRIYEQIIDSDAVHCCINTITSFPTKSAISNVIEADIDYFEQEWHSILLCMLTVLNDRMVFNLALPFNLTGLNFTHEYLIRMAQKAGLCHQRFCYESHDMLYSMNNFTATAIFFDIIVYKDKCIADQRVMMYIPENFQKQLVALLTILDRKIIMVSITFDNGSFHFNTVQQFIDYRVGSHDLIYAIQDTCQNLNF